MNRVFVTLAVLLLAAALNADAAPRQPREAKVLNRWLGVWKSRVEIKPSEWMREAMEFTSNSTVEWMLNGRFLQISTQAVDYEAREIRRYDAESGKYHMWVFDSEGDVSFWEGVWDEKSATMTWKFVDFGVGIDGKIIDRFAGDGKIESTLLMKDKGGTVLLDVRTESTRAETQ